MYITQLVNEKRKQVIFHVSVDFITVIWKMADKINFITNGKKEVIIKLAY